jgi:hypothetical protein
MRGPIFGVLVLLIAGTIRAETLDGDSQGVAVARERLKIEWSGSGSCRPTSEIVEGLRRLMGGNPDLLLTQAFLVRAMIEPETHGWTLVLSAQGSHGPFERKVFAPTCTEVAQAAALITSVWLQPAIFPLPGTAQEEPSRPSSAIATEAVAEPSHRARAVRTPSSGSLQLRQGTVTLGRSMHLRSELAFGTIALHGALPDWGSGLVGRIGASALDWRIDALFLWLAAQTTSAGTTALAGRFNLVASGLRIAYAVQLASDLNVQPGIWSLLGRLHGEGQGEMSKSTPSNDGWGAAGLGIDGNLVLGRLSFALGGGYGLPFGRPRFFVGSNLLYKTSAVAGFGHLLVAVAFP